MKKRGDVIVLIFIIIVIISALVFYIPRLFGQVSANTAIITYNGTIVKEINLTTDRVYSYPVYDSHDTEICCIEIVDGKAHFQNSTCSDQICVDAGWLEHSGDFAACVPNNVVVTIK